MCIVNLTIYFKLQYIKHWVFHLQHPSPITTKLAPFFLPAIFQVFPCHSLPSFPLAVLRRRRFAWGGGKLIPTPHPLIRRQLPTPAKRMGEGGGGLGGGVFVLANHIAAATVKGSNSGCGVRAQPGAAGRKLHGPEWRSSGAPSVGGGGKKTDSGFLLLFYVCIAQSHTNNFVGEITF